VVTFFALMRLGYTVFVISPRMQASSSATSLDKTGCRFIFYSPTTSVIAHEVGAQQQIKLVSFLSLADIGKLTSTDAQPPDQYVSENNQIVLILHSSGSTGLPKLFPMTHRQMLVRSIPVLYPNNKEFINSPLYASAGISFLFFEMHKTAPTLSGMKTCPILQKT